MLKKVMLVAAVLTIGTRANAQQCESYLGQTSSPLTFEQAIAQVPSVAPRGEFETTAQYEARRASASGTRGPLVILKEPEDRADNIRYDADNSRLGIRTYAFDNTNFDPSWGLQGTPYAEMLNPSTLANIDVVINQQDEPNGTYEGRNAMGASWTVTRINRVTQAIFERPLSARDYRNSGLFPVADSAPYFVGYIDMPPEVAQQLKPSLNLALVVEPREPFVVENTYDGRGRITVQNPIDVTNQLTVLVGDIVCGLVLDSTNRVLAAYETR